MAPNTGTAKLTIAIDGPAAAGKSTVAREVAARLGLTYVDTGAMYRALTLKALRTGTALDDGPALERLAGGTVIELRRSSEGGQEVWLDGEDVTREIRTRDVDRAVSKVSAHPGVREWFKKLQRKVGECGGVVMEGRDIGTVILPDADVKVYLDAAFETRVERRYLELQSKGFRPSRAEVAADMAVRDRLDSGRATAPLSAAPDAVKVDTTGKTLMEVVEEVTRLCRRRGEVGP
ncbi:MAG: (d)CMP kinase [Firmicutes bacterium]|nr:(d)CMP kinase [Bacillota bacterium]